MKGSRVQAVVQELRGEKIDIIPYSVDVPRYVCAAIAPAVVQRVLVDETNHQIELIVADDQLSLAIGRRGQNVKLATKLLGWDIEIHGESRIAELKTGLRPSWLSWKGWTKARSSIYSLGYHAPDNLLNADEAELAAIPGVGATLAQGIQQVAYELKQTLKQEQLNAATAEGSTAGKAEEGLTETPVRNGSDTTEEEMA